MLIAASAQANRYTVVDLGFKVTPNKVNKQGDAAGTSTFKHAFVYRNDHWKKLKNCEDGSSSAIAINAGGDVVGDSGGWPTIWKRGSACEPVNLPTRAHRGSANAVSSDGTVAGWFERQTEYHCFLTHPDGSSEDLGLIGTGNDCLAYGMNEHGQVVGGTNKDLGKPMKAFLWQGGQFRSLGVLPGGRTSLAFAINDRGHVVGRADTASSNAHAFLWSGGTMKDIGESAAFTDTVASDINGQGEIVGYGANGSLSEAVRFADGDVIPLLSEVSNPEGWQLTVASGISGDGTIVGTGLLDGVAHGFKLVPQNQP